MCQCQQYLVSVSIITHFCALYDKNYCNISSAHNRKGLQLYTLLPPVKAAWQPRRIQRHTVSSLGRYATRTWRVLFIDSYNHLARLKDTAGSGGDENCPDITYK